MTSTKKTTTVFRNSIIIVEGNVTAIIKYGINEVIISAVAASADADGNILIGKPVTVWLKGQRPACWW